MTWPKHSLQTQAANEVWRIARSRDWSRDPEALLARCRFLFGEAGAASVWLSFTALAAVVGVVQELSAPGFARRGTSQVAVPTMPGEAILRPLGDEPRATATAQECLGLFAAVTAAAAGEAVDGLCFQPHLDALAADLQGSAVYVFCYQVALALSDFADMTHADSEARTEAARLAFLDLAGVRG